MNIRGARYTVESAWEDWSSSRTPQAREWLVVNYSSLVKFVAGRLGAGLPKNVDTADLVSAGIFGLMDAIEKYVPVHGAKFETYAVPRIRGAILDSLRALDWVPRSVRTKARSVQTAITQLEHTMGRAPNDEEIAEELQITVEELQKWLADVAVGTVGPLDHLVADRAPRGLANKLAPPIPQWKSKQCGRTCVRKLKTCQNVNELFWFSTTTKILRWWKLVRSSALPRVVCRKSIQKLFCNCGRVSQQPSTNSLKRRSC